MLKIQEYNFKIIIKILSWILQPLGIWITGTEKWSKSVKKILIILSITLILFLLIPCFLHTFLIEKTIDDRLKIFAPLCFMSYSLCKYITLLLREKSLKDFIKNINNDWKIGLQSDEHKNILLKNLKSAINLVIIFTMSSYTAGIFFTTILPLTTKPIIIGNDTIRYLGFPGYFVILNHQVSTVSNLYLIH